MNENKSENGFSYSYSAREQEEIKKIRKKYAEDSARTDESSIERLRRLDASVTKKGTVASIIVGVISSIVMGAGMSLIMTDIGAFLPEMLALFIGIAVGVVGMVGVALAYPIYKAITKKERERIAPEVLRITEELLK
ncbi:MAG: hypothetical protein IKA68_03560 [Clostridia bacterium]|nr:hypothetical protein [Clostridia bacterium]